MNKDEKIVVIVFILCVLGVGFIEGDVQYQEQQVGIHNNINY